MELFFVAGHDANDPVLVQIPGQVLYFQTAGSELFHAELKQGCVVGLIVELAALPDYPAVFVQEAPVGQAALGVLLPGPGVGEVDEQPVDLLPGEDLFDVGNVHIDEEYIG